MLENTTDLLWVTVCGSLVVLMQAGFCLVESGLSRSKHGVNVALKNLVDFCFCGTAFWLVGYHIMCGPSCNGLIGAIDLPLSGNESMKTLTFFFFQLVFCGTAVTIISGAVAERMKFNGYLIVCFLVSVVIYPVMGHWAWGGEAIGYSAGWLRRLGFIDFAGSTVVHCVGGWCGLTLAWFIGPRLGRFSRKRPEPSGHAMGIATVGTLLLWFSWIGFNGGSTLAFNESVLRVVINTNLAAAAGGLVAVLIGASRGRVVVMDVLISVMAALVAVTAGAHLYSFWMSFVVGGVAAVAGLLFARLLNLVRIDDVVGVGPVHIAGGIWGTLAIPLFVSESRLPTGNWLSQLAVQSLGVVTCFLLSAGCVLLLAVALRLFGYSLRASHRHEVIGLSEAEHGAVSDMANLLRSMNRARRSGQFDRRSNIDSSTEIGRVAVEYDRVLHRVHQEIETREAVATTLQIEQQRTASIVNQAEMGIYQLNLDGAILDMNPKLLEILGGSLDGWNQKRIPGSILPAWISDSKVREMLDLAIAGNEATVEFEHSYQAPVGNTSHKSSLDGNATDEDAHVEKVLWFREKISIISAQDGSPMFYLGLLDDQTESRESARREIDLAQEASRAKSDFLASMSHEIRTPLNGVIGMLDLLSNEELPATASQFTKVAKESSDALLCLINDILDFSKIEAGRIDLESVPFDIHELIDNVIELFAIQAHRKNVELTYQIDPSLPKFIKGDPDRFRQILNNLLSNSIKFTSKGEVNLSLGVVDDDAIGKQSMHLKVRDTGIGMTQETIRRLFTKFTQADSSTTRRFGGTGLGLAICTRLAELMDGRIAVKSELGIGSTFELVMPFKKVAEVGYHGEIETDLLEQSLNQLRVLFVDDNATNRLIISEQLQRWGARVATSSSPKSTLNHLRNAAAQFDRFDLLILDYQMPGMSGSEVADLVRSDSVVGKIPMILLSSGHDVLRPESLKNSGFNATLCKPARPSRLFDTIVSIMNGIEPAMSGAKPVNSRFVDSTSRLSTDLNDCEQSDFRGASPMVGMEPSLVSSRLRILVVDDNKINQMVVMKMLESIDADVAVVNNGRLALEHVRAIPTDLVLMDCHMPEMDGLEATAAIRAIPSHSTLPIIALTADAVIGTRERCIASGMTDYLSKPIIRQRLLAMIQAYTGSKFAFKRTTKLNQQNESLSIEVKLAGTESKSNLETTEPGGLAEGELIAVPQCLSESASASGSEKTDSGEPKSAIINTSDTWLDFDDLVKRAAGDTCFARELLTDFRGSLRDHVLDIQDATNQGNNEMVAKLSHSLKGTSANLSAIVLKTIVESIEQSARAGHTEASKTELTRLEYACSQTIDAIDTILKGLPS